jgi:hypothetical protein
MAAQLVCHSAGIVGQAGASTPIIGREGLLGLVEWAERPRVRDLEGGEASWTVRTRASSPDGGADEEGTVDVVFGGEPERCSEVLSMLLERSAVSAGPAAEGTGGEHGAAA